MTGHEAARKMNECHFKHRKTKCHSILESLMNLNNNTIITDTLKIDHFLIQQLYDKIIFHVHIIIHYFDHH